MSNIINHKTIQVNFILIPKNPIDINIDAVKLKNTLLDDFKDSKAIITQFPEVFVLFDPDNQITITILKDQNKIIIADNRITPYSGRTFDNFFPFVKKAVDIINKNDIKDYGFNIISNFDLENDSSNSGEFIKDNFINKENLNTFGDLKSAGLKLTYSKDDIRNEIKIEPMFGLKLEPTKSVMVNHNSHFANASLPSHEQLQKDCQKIYDNLPNDLTSIFSLSKTE